MAPKHAQLQIFIQANITVEKKTKNLPRTISGHFIKVFYKKPLLSGPKSGW